jgi:uncharacterized metal-binding protein YceD (DUF177 family)
VSEKVMPWRAPVAVAEIPEHGLHRDIEANETERLAIAALTGLRELPRLSASFDLTHAGGGSVLVRGRVRAEAGQTCVVTLEPLTTEVDEDVDVMFSSDIQPAAGTTSDVEADDTLAEDPPEPIVGGRIDLGALAAEFLILGLDPYPRKPGVVFEPVVQPVDPADHPFAALASLKNPDSPAKPRKSKGK